MTKETIHAVDLFCGAGGLSWALVEALQDVAIDADQPTQAVLEDVIDLVGVNHWEQAIETHAANHPWARHFHDDIQTVNPREVFDDPDPAVKILSGESNARTGVPLAVGSPSTTRSGFQPGISLPGCRNSAQRTSSWRTCQSSNRGGLSTRIASRPGTAKPSTDGSTASTRWGTPSTGKC